MICAPPGRHADRLDPVTKKKSRTSYRSWRKRGWCVLEMFTSFVSRYKRYPNLLIRSGDGQPEWVSSLDTQILRCGESEFTCCLRNHVLTTATQKVMRRSTYFNMEDVDNLEQYLHDDVDSSMTKRINSRRNSPMSVSCDKIDVRDILEALITAKICYYINEGDMTRARVHVCMQKHWMKGLPEVKAEKLTVCPSRTDSFQDFKGILVYDEMTSTGSPDVLDYDKDDGDVVPFIL